MQQNTNSRAAVLFCLSESEIATKSEKWGKRIQAAAYNGVHTVYSDNRKSY